MPAAPAEVLPAAFPALAALAASVPIVGGVVWASLAPANQLWGTVLSRAAAPDDCHYALTFDDGPTPGATDRILDTLADLRAPAAFYVIGASCQRHPDLLRRIHAEGHLVGAHSWHHSHYSMLRGPRYWQREFDDTNAIIQQIIGLRPATFRPPMGVKTPFLHRAARRADQHVVTWNRRALDGVSTTAERILRRLVPATRPGDILLLHDGIQPHRPHHDPAPTVAALRPLITQLRARNLEPQRLDSLLSLPPYHPNN